MGKKCEPWCECKRHNQPVCELGCTCKRHGGRVFAPGDAPSASFRVRFFMTVPPPYGCGYCGIPVSPGGIYSDGNYLVLRRRDGNVKNTAIENLIPYHRRCLQAVLHKVNTQECECGLTTNAGSMAQHMKKHDHRLMAVVNGNSQTM